MNNKPFFIDVMSKKQRLTYTGLIAFWFCTLIWFWSWWLKQDHFVTLWGMYINSLVIGWTLILPGYYFLFVYRMKIANPELDPPEGSYAMVVTKAPSEPWSVVSKTLTAMLKQKFPYEYDVWLATETIDDEIVSWCHKHNVHISCRDGVVGYQNASFPRKARCKEGNLTYFYEQAGGFNYDFISQLDADHVPTETYLLEMSRPFADPKVGYVAAPSICDANSDESWVVRARLYMEASLHGSLQAGYCRDWAPMPIGSHYMVRKTALQSLVHKRNGQVVAVGTLGPELAEDHTTGLAMNSAGWRGAFALNAIAHGDGAGCFADSVTQEFQWAGSLMRTLLVWTKGYWSGLPIPVVKYVGKPMAYTTMMAAYVMFAFTLRADIVFRTIIPDVGPYHSYAASDISQIIMSAQHEGQILLSATVNYISNILPSGILPYTIVIVGMIWICLIGILIKMTSGTSTRRPNGLFPASQASVFEEPYS